MPKVLINHVAGRAAFAIVRPTFKHLRGPYGERIRLSAGIHGHQRASESLSGLSDRLEVDLRVRHADHGFPRDFPYPRLSPKGCPCASRSRRKLEKGRRASPRPLNPSRSSRASGWTWWSRRAQARAPRSPTPITLRPARLSPPTRLRPTRTPISS